MARVRFSKDFDWKPSSQTTIAYPAGREYTVRRECADAATAAGAGSEIEQPRKNDDGDSA